MTDPVLPHSEELEGSLIARLLIDPAQLPVIAGELAPADLYTGRWRKAYAAMQKLSESRQAIDIVTLQAEMGDEEGELNRRVSELYQSARAPIQEYVSRLRALAFRRRMIGELEALSRRAYEETDRDRLLSEMHRTVVNVSAGYEDGSLISPLKAAEAYKRVLAERAAGVRPGLAWPLETLEEMLLPATGGELILVAARPSIGKTVLAEQVADRWARQSPHPVLFASLEMSLAQLFDRAVSRATSLPASDIIRGILTTQATVAVLAAIEERQHVQIWYLDDPFATTNSLRAAAAKVRLLGGGLGGIVVDYIQLLKDRGDQEVQRVTVISRTLKAIAREFDVPMLALSQLNRAVTARGPEDQRPRLHDLRESGALEQDADRVIALSRKPGEHQTTFEVLKARSGGGVNHPRTIWFDGEHVRFIDMTQLQAEEAAAAAQAVFEGNAQAIEAMA